MKKYKFIDIINFICVFYIFSEMLMIFSIFLSDLFRSETLVSILLIPEYILIIPLTILERILKFLPLTEYIGDLILVLAIFIFFIIAELFLIIEKIKFNNYFFPDFSEKTRRWIFRFSIIGFIISIIFSYLTYVAAIF